MQIFAKTGLWCTPLVHEQSELTFHSRRQGNKPAPQPTGKGYAMVHIIVKMWILLGDNQWWRMYLESMLIVLLSSGWDSSVKALKALQKVNTGYFPYWQTIIIMSF